jgi:hypothetical protein
VSGLLVVYAVRALGLSTNDARIGLLFTAGALGSLLASLLLPQATRRFPVGWITLGAMLYPDYHQWHCTPAGGDARSSPEPGQCLRTHDCLGRYAVRSSRRGPTGSMGNDPHNLPGYGSWSGAQYSAWLVFASEGAKDGERTCGSELEALYLLGIARCLHMCYDHCIMLVFRNISSYLVSEV